MNNIAEVHKIILRKSAQGGCLEMLHCLRQRSEIRLIFPFTIYCRDMSTELMTGAIVCSEKSFLRVQQVHGQ